MDTEGEGRAAGIDAPRDLGWAIVFSGLLLFLLLVAFERAFAMVFVLNFSTAGPGASVSLVLFFLSAYAYPLGLHRHWPHRLPLLDGTVLATTALVVISLTPLPWLAALAALLAFVAATPLLFTLVQHLRGRFAEGAVFALLLYGAGRAWLDTAPFAALPAGWLWTSVAAAAGLSFWWLFVRPGLAATRDAGPPPRTHLVTPFLFLMFVFLGNPTVVARWLGEPLLPFWGAALAGLFLGLAVARLPPLDSWAAHGASTTILLVGLFVLLTRAPLALLVYPLTLASVLHLLARDLDRPAAGSIRRVAHQTGLFQVLALVLVFLFGVAPSWAFLPAGAAQFVHGSAVPSLLGLGALYVAGTFLWTGARAPWPRPTGHVLPGRAFASALLLVVLVTAGGLVVHEGPAPPPAATTPPLRVATYNVHQYFSSGQTGHYNLEAVAAVIETSGADIIGLQETEGARITSGNLDGIRWLAHRLDMHHAPGPPTAEQVYGIALLSRHPILETAWIHLPAHESVERTAMRADIETPFGPLPVFVTHLQTQEFPADRQRQAERLVAWVEPAERAWVLGDFNSPAGPDDGTYRLLTDHYADAWVASGRPRGSGDTTLDDTVATRIDHIFVKGDWKSEACRTYGDRRASDHALVACDLAPPGWPDGTM